MFMPGVWFLWSKKKNIIIIFQKENGNTFTLLIIILVKSIQKEQNSTNHLLWPPICRNKPAINPKWFNSSDTNSTYLPKNMTSYVNVPLFDWNKSWISDQVPLSLLVFTAVCFLHCWYLPINNYSPCLKLWKLTYKYLLFPLEWNLRKIFRLTLFQHRWHLQVWQCLSVC